jgi:hypothetical protein
MQLTQGGRELECQREEDVQVKPGHGEQRLPQCPTSILEHEATPTIVT